MWERVLEEPPCPKPRPDTPSDVFWDKSSFLLYFSLFIGPPVGQLHKLFVFPFLSVTELLAFFCVSFFFFFFKPRYFPPSIPCLKNVFHFEVPNLCSLKELMNKWPNEWMYKCIPEWMRNCWSSNTSPHLRASPAGHRMSPSTRCVDWTLSSLRTNTDWTLSSLRTILPLIFRVWYLLFKEWIVHPLSDVFTCLLLIMCKMVVL